MADLPFTVAPVEGKGLGAFANRVIEAGERLLADKPLFVLPATVQGTGITSESLEKTIEALSAEDRGRFWALAQDTALYGDEITASGIAGTNGIPFSHFGRCYCSVFATVSRFNHSCEPNTCYNWNGALGQLTIHASKRIEAGSEVTICYLGSLMPRPQRQRQLLQDFGFECMCAKCVLAGEALAESDERIATIGDYDSGDNDSRLMNSLRRWGAIKVLITLDAGKVLAELERVVTMLEAEAPGVRAGHVSMLEAEGYVLAM